MGVIPEQNSVNTLVRISNRLFWSTVSLETFSNWWVANLRSFWNRTKARVSSQENLKQKKLFRQGSLQKLAVGWKKNEILHENLNCLIVTMRFTLIVTMSVSESQHEIFTMNLIGQMFCPISINFGYHLPVIGLWLMIFIGGFFDQSEWSGLFSQIDRE